jgi:pilus assembly protein CpaD
MEEHAMPARLCSVAMALLLALSGCVPGAAEYTSSEAPNRLAVDGVRTEIQLAFAPGAARLSAAEAGRLDRLVASGAVLPADRVAVAASGDPSLAHRRAAAVATELLRWGIVADARALPGVPRNRAIVTVGRYAVTLPACPNWSKSPATDFGNAPSSNFGCATATNLGLMTASPGDLVSGRPLAAADAMPAANAVDRYLQDKVKLPLGVAIGPVPASGGGDAVAPMPGGGQ